MTLALDIIGAMVLAQRAVKRESLLMEWRIACHQAAALRQRQHFDLATRIMVTASVRTFGELQRRFGIERVRRHRDRILDILRRAKAEVGI